MKQKRQRGALERLEAQLKKGTKRNRENERVKLTDSDKKRIEKEIKILKKRLDY